MLGGFIKNYLKITFIFVSIFLIFNRSWIFAEDILFGLNWDFTFPDYEILRNKIVDWVLYSYSNHWEEPDLILAHLIPNYFFGNISQEISSSILNKTIFFFTNYIAFIGMYLLTRKHVKNQIAIFSSLLYAFSPFFFNLLIGGSWYSWLGYAFAPLFINYSLSYILYGKSSDLLKCGASHLIFISFIQYYFLSVLIVIVWFFSLGLSLKEKGKEVVTLITLLFLLSLYWLIPLIVNFQLFSEHTIEIADFNSIKNSGQSIFHVMNLSGFLDRFFYYRSFSDNLIYKFIYLLSVFTFFALISITSVQLLKNNKVFKFLFIFCIFLIFLIKGNNPPLGSISLFIYESLPFMKMYRSPQNLYFGFVFLFIILLSFALDRFEEHLKRKYLFYTAVVILFFAYTIGWWIDGDLGNRNLKNKNNGHITFYHQAKELEEMFSRNINSMERKNELFLPLDKSVFFNKYNAQGGDPNYLYLENYPPLSRYNSEELNKEFKNGIPYFLIAQHNIGFISLRKDIRDHFKDFSIFDSFNLRESLAKKYENIVRNDYLETYRVDDSSYIPYFISCPEIEFISEDMRHGIKELVELDEKTKNKILCRVVLSQKSRETSPIQVPLKVDVDYKNQIEKKVLLKGFNYRDKIILRSAQKFNNSWELFLNNKKLKRCSNQNQFLEETCQSFYFFMNKPNKFLHKLRFEGYPYDFNGWEIDVKGLSAEFPELFHQNNKTKIELELILRHKNQFIVDFTRIISLTTFFILVFISLFEQIKKIAREKK